MKAYNIPKKLSPYYSYSRIPRKLKKKLKKQYRFVFDRNLKVNETLWEILGLTNPDFKSFLIREVCRREEKKN